MNIYADIIFSSKTIGPSTNIYSIDHRGTLTKITDNTSWKDTEATLAQNGDIVFVSNRKKEIKVDLNKQSEDYNIFKIASTSGEISQLSFAPELEHSPVISRDGQWIAYIQKAGPYRKLMLLKSGEKTPVTLDIANDISSLSWAPNKRTLAYVKYNNPVTSIQLLDVSTREKQSLLQTTLQARNENQVLNATFNTLFKNEDTAFEKNIVGAQWSPNGRKIAYILGSNKDNTRQLRVLDIWNHKEMAVSPENAQVQFPVSWSNKYDKLVYSSLEGYKFYFDEKTYRKVYEGAMHIFLADLTSGELKQLTEGDYLHNRPVFSPDDSKIAFLYGDNLGARVLALHTFDIDGAHRKEFYDRVAGNSFLIWR